MIGPVTVRVSAAHPDVPLREVPVFRGSSCTVGIEGVPAFFGSAAVTSVSVGMQNALGEVRAVAAKRAGCMWVATFSAEFFAVPGSVRNGLSVSAGGLEEDGETAASWILGKGDVCIIDGAAVPAPGEVWNNVHLRDSVPASPVKGDLAKVGDVWKVFDGVAWRALGGSSVVESETNPGYAAHADFAERATRDGDGVPFATGYAKVGDLAVVLDLVGSGTAGSPYTIQLGGVVQTFAQVKALAETRNSVIRHGRGTYRVTYVGAAEMMWDCTGTVQGEVLTGTIHMFAAGDVVQLVAARSLATTEQVSSIGVVAEEAAGAAGIALGFSAYPMAAVEGGALEDRTINYAAAGGTFTFPASAGTNARDFVLVIGALPYAPTVTFPGTPTLQYVSDQPADEVWTAEANKVNAWYFSEVSVGVFMVAHKAMDYVAQ